MIDRIANAVRGGKFPEIERPDDKFRGSQITDDGQQGGDAFVMAYARAAFVGIGSVLLFALMERTLLRSRGFPERHGGTHEERRHGQDAEQQFDRAIHRA